MIKRFAMRLPDDLHAELATLAAQKYRSLHAQIILLLRWALQHGGRDL